MYPSALWFLSVLATTWPQQPADPSFPGGSSVLCQSEARIVSDSGRTIHLYLPTGQENVPVIVFAHGQGAIPLAYGAMMQHLNSKCIAAIYVDYDTNPLDSDYPRMANDTISQARLAIQNAAGVIDPQKVVFSGVSKGALVALFAATENDAEVQPKALLLFHTPDDEMPAVSQISPSLAVTFVASDQDTTTPVRMSEEFFNSIPVSKKQLIVVRSLTELDPPVLAVHGAFKSFGFLGSQVSPLHWFSYWKYLVAAAWDLNRAALFTDPFLYGDDAAATIPGHAPNTVIRNTKGEYDEK